MNNRDLGANKLPDVFPKDLTPNNFLRIFLNSTRNVNKKFIYVMKNEELHQTFVTFLYFSYILYVKESKDKHIRTTGKL